MAIQECFIGDSGYDWYQDDNTMNRLLAESDADRGINAHSTNDMLCTPF